MRKTAKNQNLRSSELTPAERSAAASQLARKRWSKISPAERSAILTEVASHGAGRKRTPARRCPCGNMTMKCALSRADKNCQGLGHQPGCIFYRAHRHLERGVKSA